MADNSVDSIVTDPPYGLEFMGKDWDKLGNIGRDRQKNIQKTSFGKIMNSNYETPRIVRSKRKKCSVCGGYLGGIFKQCDCLNPLYEIDTYPKAMQNWHLQWATECLRVLKPGGHLLSFGGSRTYHRMACAIEDAGFEIRDMVEWVYGSGFPKSLNIGKAIAKLNGDELKEIGNNPNHRQSGALFELGFQGGKGDGKITVADNDWNGYGTALKPAHEPICLARKPLSEKSVAENVLKWGTGGIAIDKCRVAGEYKWRASDSKIEGTTSFKQGSFGDAPHSQGRFPANLCHDGSDEVLAVFPQTKSGALNEGHKRGKTEFYGGGIVQANYGNDSGSASRFFASFPIDKICPLCNVVLCKDNNKEVELWKSTLALYATKNGWTTQAITEFIARLSAMLNQNEQLVQSVRSVENLCGQCETFIVLALAGIKNSAFSKEELQVILDSIVSFKNSILIQNLVSYVEMKDSIDTIPTMTSLLKLFGYANPATTNCTQETERSELKSCVYSAKASKAERDMGCEALDIKQGYDFMSGNPNTICNVDNSVRKHETPTYRNNHPTVKPLALMRYLCRLITPPNGIVLDPFAGSGTTGCACALEGFEFIGIEREQDYIKIAELRIKHWGEVNKNDEQLELFTLEK